MTEEAKIRMNLVAIQNVDPYAKAIIDSSPHVAFYKFVGQEWQKSEIEGSFFVYSRVAEPYNSIFINNRLNTNSLVEPINRSIQLQLQAPFLLYRNQRSNISGFWFYCKEDCVRIHSLLEKLIKKCNNSKNDSDEQQQSEQQQIFPKNGNGGNVDIFSMLSKAQEDFNNSSATERLIPQQQPINQQFTGMHLNNQQPQQVSSSHQPLMKQLSSNIMPDITSNVVNFFAAAQQPNGKPDGGHIIQNQFVAHHTKAPPVQTLDEIEKQHRVSASPPQSKIEHKTNFNNLLNSVAQQQQQSISPQPLKLQQPGAFQPPNKPSLITPAMLQAQPTRVEEKTNTSQMCSVQSNIRPEPLTQNQLIQALNYLMESDPEFIRKVHEAYVKSFNKIVSL